MVEHPDGRRTLIAPSVDVAQLVGGLYAFDDTVVGDVSTERSLPSVMMLLAVSRYPYVDRLADDG